MCVCVYVCVCVDVCACVHFAGECLGVSRNVCVVCAYEWMFGRIFVALPIGASPWGLTFPSMQRDQTSEHRGLYGL
jgi:hypothetical protein